MKQKLSYPRCLILITIISLISVVCPIKIWAQQYNFSVSNLTGIVLSNPTSLQFGPDGRLYVSEQSGLIKAFTIVRNAANNYSATSTEIIDLVNKIPNHNDDGTLNPGGVTRQVSGLLVKGTATNPIIYVTSSDPRIGGPSGDKNLDTNSGILSSITWNGSAWVKIDLVRGLPRSEENHATNGIQLNPNTNVLYLAQGGNTNAGSPCTNFAFTCEYAYSAAILSVDLNAINQMPTRGSGNTAYKYDLPTLNDPTRADSIPSVQGSDAIDVMDPFGGNDGLNQAKIEPGSPVQIFAPGFRNVYDILITQSGNMYTCDNGANPGWGGYPENEGTANVTNNYVTGEPGSTTASSTEAVVNNLDNLHYIGNINTYVPGSFYGGHPNPVRANPNGAGLWTQTGTIGVWRNSKTGANPLPSDWPPVPVANPIEGDFQMPGVEDNAILTFTSSTNGLTEYTASNFNSVLKGSILAASYDGYIDKIGLTPDGTDATNSRNPVNKLDQDPKFASNFGAQPLDIVAQGDNDVFPGTVWVAVYGLKAIAIFEPQDFLNCTGAYNNADDDGDGYTNADEMDNKTNPCSASSLPPDNDQDHISDLNDPDDDNDGIDDTKDFFALDKDNGLTTTTPITYDLFNNYPQTGFYGLGFTGLMTNNVSNYSQLYSDSNLVAGGAVGAFSIVSVPEGDALGTLNTQQNAFQFGLKPADKLPFTIQSRLLGPFFNNKTPQNYQSQGIYMGTGDQDNYLKIDINANGGQGGIEIVFENNAIPVTTQYIISGILSSSTVDLFLSVNPVTGAIQPKYSLNNGRVLNLGSPIQASGALLTALQGSGTAAPAFAVGVIATSRGASPFTATWDFIYVTTDPQTSAGTWVTITPVSGAIIAREENGYVSAGDKFYLMGGRGISAVQAYDPVLNTWVNKGKPPVEINHFQPVTLNGLIYVVGSMNGPYPHEVPLPNVYVYNPTTDKWFTGSTIPVARRRGAGGTVVYNNKIYTVGGITDGHWAGWVNWFDEYDPATNTWKILPDAPRVRDHFNAVIINSKLYVAGGRRSSTSTNQTFDLTIPEVDVYDFSNGIWSTLPSASNLPIPRAGASNVVLDNEVIVIGGESGIQTTAHKETHALNVITNTWRRLGDLQTGRHGTGAIVSNKDIYIAAGPANRGGSGLLTTQEDYFVSSSSTPDGTPLSQSPLSDVSALDLGSIAINSQSSKILTLTNSGSNQDILVSSITITGASSFSYTAPFPFPFTIAPGAGIDVTVQFNPTVAGAQTANLVVTHSGQTGATTTSLTGTGTSVGTTQQVTSFTLINAISDQDIQTISNGDVLNLSTLPSRSLNIRANTSPASVGSVVFNLSGQQIKTQTETLIPLALFGDNNGNYNNWTPAVGSYTLKCTPYTLSGGKGTAGMPLTINFTVSDPSSSSQVTSFTLINAVNNQDIQTINNGDVLNLTALPSRSLNIRANTSPASVGSVVFNLSGQQTRTQIETLVPLALFGDNKGNYNRWTPALGNYTLKCTPYSLGSGKGTAGTALTVGFSVINQAAAAIQTIVSAKNQVLTQTVLTTAKAYPNPGTNGQFTILLPSKFQGELSFTLTSLTGKKLREGKLALKGPTSVLTFDFSREMIESGLYYLELQTKEQKTYVTLTELNSNN